MSLSRHFKNTPSFLAEDLFKQSSDKASSPWTPDPRKDEQPFQRQPISSKSAARRTLAGKDAVLPNSFPEKQGGDNEPIDPSPTTSESDHTVLLPSEKNIDLSKYLERGAAEKKATEAYQHGLTEGRAKAELDFGAATQALLLACQQMDTLRATIIGNSSKELVEFSLAIAEKILRLSVREQDQTIVATIEEALRRAVKSDEFTIHIHPEDYEILAAKSAEIVAGLSGLNNLIIRKDATIARGGTRIDSDNCTIDATIDSQFEIIKEELKKKNP